MTSRKSSCHSITQLFFDAIIFYHAIITHRNVALKIIAAAILPQTIKILPERVESSFLEEWALKKKVKRKIKEKWPRVI